MLPTLSNLPRPGDVLYAQLIADIIRELRRQDESLRSGAWGLTAAVLAARLPDFFVPAYITRVYPEDAHTVATPAGQVFYDVVGVGRPDAALTHAAPFYGRPVRDPMHMILAASVDHDAVLVRSNDVEGTPRARLMLLPGSEVRATRVCGGK